MRRGEKVNRVEKLKKWLVENGYKGKQTFNTRNWAGDEMATVYQEDGIFVDYAVLWDYLEIFGLTDDEYKSLSNILDIS